MSCRHEIVLKMLNMRHGERFLKCYLFLNSERPVTSLHMKKICVTE